MTSLVYHEDKDYTQVWHALVLSLGLHLLVIAIYPVFSRITLPELPEKLEIEFFSIKARSPSSEPQVTEQPVQTPTAPEQVTPTIQPPTARQVTKPVLAAPASAEADYSVPHQAQAVKPEPAPAEPAAAATPAVAAAAVSESASHTVNETKDSKPVPSPATQSASESDELSATDQDAWGDYGDQLRALVNKSKQYPAIAIRRHLEGDATVVAQFVRGELTAVSLLESSKHVPLDDEAVRMVKKAIGQLGVKESLKKKTFKITIPVSFRLE